MARGVRKKALEKAPLQCYAAGSRDDIEALREDVLSGRFGFSGDEELMDTQSDALCTTLSFFLFMGMGRLMNARAMVREYPAIRFRLTCFGERGENTVLYGAGGGIT